MKTRNAFALRDFDATRILQRPYFKNFREEYHIADKTDDEILESLNAADDDSAKNIRHKVFCLQSLRSLVESYIKRMAQHGTKLAKYTQAVGEKIITDETADIKSFRERHKRARKFIDKYNGALVQWNDEPTEHSGIKWLLLDLLKRIIDQQKKLEDMQSHYRNIFALRLKEVRKEMNLTQAELATRLNITQRAVGYYETATQEPSIAMLVKISKELNRPIDWLVGAI